MRKFAFIILTSAVLSACVSSNSIFELSPSQSMSITGKGPGQDAANNPYSNQKSIAIIKNIGKNSFVIRVQNKGKLIDEITLNPSHKNAIILEKDSELYLDSEFASKARLKFKKAQ